METKNNSGAIFKNAKKTNEKQPDWKGNVNVNGKIMEISLWVKTSQKGTQYFSAAFQEPFKKENETKTYSNETKYTPKIDESDLPF
jgi:uncharacterized protein (DUF736 family)